MAWVTDVWDWLQSWVQWGTVPAWLSGIGTTSAFFATFYIIRRDSNTRRRTQASQIAYYASRLSIDSESSILREDPKGDVGGIVIANLSKEAIYSVETHHLDRTDRSVVHIHYVADVLMPDRTICVDTGAYVTYGIDLKFRDNSGLSWVRTLRRGRGLFRQRGTPTVAAQHRRNRGRHYVTAPDLPTRDPTKRTITLQSGTDLRRGVFRRKEVPMSDREE